VTAPGISVTPAVNRIAEVPMPLRQDSVQQNARTTSMEFNRKEENINCIVPTGCTIEGTMVLQSGAHLQGRIVGNIKCTGGTLIIDKTCVVFGRVEAHGRLAVLGQIHAPDDGVAIYSTKSLILGEAARVTGHVEYNRFNVFEGAEINGRLAKIKDVESKRSLS
jgi:cytoskeletal protein CcmA (bactofilin family)